jgi:hypothetical protein
MTEYLNLPPSFCVETTIDNRTGYAYLRTTEQAVAQPQTPEGPTTLFIINTKNHDNRYFRILNDNPHILQNRTTWRNTLTRKANGNIQRVATWRCTGVSLRYRSATGVDLDYPVIKFRNTQAVMPVPSIRTFIPLVNQPAAPAAPAAPVLIPPIIIAKDEIPQHAIKLMLLGAIIEGETCPITTDEITIENGAITSCFHLFEKTALARWLQLPASRNMCPLCKDECNMYSMNEDVPPLAID